MILKSLLGRAESSQYLTNGCVNSASASRDELLIALGLEVKDAILKLLKEKASEERILLSLRATICKMFMSSIEQRSANIDIEEIYNLKKRKRKNKKKKEGHVAQNTPNEAEDVEFNHQEHMKEKMQNINNMHFNIEDEETNTHNNSNNFTPFEMQPVEYRIVGDEEKRPEHDGGVFKTRKENLQPEDELEEQHYN